MSLRGRDAGSGEASLGGVDGAAAGSGSPRLARGFLPTAKRRRSSCCTKVSNTSFITLERSRFGKR